MQYAWTGPKNPEDHDALSRWVSQKSFGNPENIWPDSSGCGILKDGRPLAGFIFHDFKPSAGTVQFSGAATNPEWVKGPSLHYLYSYMFDGLGCQMVTTGNAPDNKRLHRLLEKTGHRKYIIERGWGRHEDMFFWTLTQEQWLENPLMQRSRKWAEELRNVKSTKTD